jgi:hypothetical protein
MLINCPRCGFSQPKDQYCAQCGVDMEAFKPKADPVLQKIFKSTTTHIFILLLAALFVGQYVIRIEEPQRWVQKITRFQAVSKSKSKSTHSSEVTETDEAQQKAARTELVSDNAAQLQGLKNKEIEVNGATEQPIQVGQQNSAIASGDSSSDIQNPTFRIIYAEVPTDMIAKWVNESSNAGLYQNLQDYSAGILSDFRKKMDSSVHILKISEKKLAVSQSDTTFSGTLSDEGSQMIGLATALDYKSNENNIVHGTVVVNRTQKQVRDHFPAEFDLPKSSVFFMLGVLRRQSFTAERGSLNMPPFQIFKSTDFMTQKTEFVIIIEPEYK